ncbi:MAG: hypothetical protein WCJ01_02735 [Ignavibacteria bacterium]
MPMISKITIVFGVIMGFIYIAVGVLVYFSDILHFSQDYQKRILGGIIVVYGCYRFYRVYKKSSDRNQNYEGADEN